MHLHRLGFFMLTDLICSSTFRSSSSASTSFASWFLHRNIGSWSIASLPPMEGVNGDEYHHLFVRTSLLSNLDGLLFSTAAKHIRETCLPTTSVAERA
ncbi:hypothetical protein ACQKWADRAFT_303075 [Trichoderma austrokoningii]